MENEQMSSGEVSTAESVDVSPDNSGQDNISQVQNAESQETETSAPLEEGQDALAVTNEGQQTEPDEFAQWAQAKGLNHDKMSETERKIAEMYRNQESAYGKSQSELKALKDQIEQSRVTKQEQEAQQREQQEKELSPIDRHRQEFGEALNTMVALSGVQSESEFAQRYPDMYQNLRAHEEQAYRDALTKHSEWLFDQKYGQREQSDYQGKLNEEMTRAKQAYMNNLNEIKNKDPQFVNNFTQSGMYNVAVNLSNALKVPVQYILADKEIFGKLAEASNAMVQIKSWPKREENLKAQWQKDLLKSKESQLLPANDESMDDVAYNALKSIQTFGKGVSMLD